LARCCRSLSSGDDPAAVDFLFDSVGLSHALELLRANLGQTLGPRPAALPIQLPEQLPERGVGPRTALDEIAPAFLAGAARLGHPGFFAHMDPPTPWITWAASLWGAALNQNLLHTDTAPTSQRLETLVVGWLAPFFGMNGGHLVPGSTVANLTALWAARELRGVTEVVASAAAHISIRKAAAILGLGFRSVAIDEQQRLRTESLGDLRRAALVLTAGTVAAGAVDPLNTRLDAAWVHVDAAWGGPLRLSFRHSSLLDGIERANSVSVSAHKWLFQPKECAVVLFSDVEQAHAALAFAGGYLAQPNFGILGSHGTRAVPLLATLLAWGRQGVAERIDRCMELAVQLAARIRQHDALELFSPPVTGVVLWRPRTLDPQRVHQRLENAFVSLTALGDQRWFRSVSANPLAAVRRLTS
jgi:L-2,4-diaminobutyrate decarboxylase